MSEFKRCSKCNKKLELNDKNFYFNKTRNYFDNTCKSCRSKSKRAKKDGNFVYMLKLKGEIIYIGKTIDLHRRLLTHMQEKIFDEVYALEFENRSNMDLAEMYFIHKYNPIFNKEFKYENDKIIDIYEFDILTWNKVILKKEDGKFNFHITNDIKEDLISNYNELKILSENIRYIKNASSIFKRKRGERYYIYAEINRKQKLIKSLDNVDEAENLLSKIKKIHEMYKKKLL